MVFDDIAVETRACPARRANLSRNVWRHRSVQSFHPITITLMPWIVTKPAAPSLPPRKPPATSVQPFQSLNPFLHSLPSVPSPTPTLQNDPEEEDEDLRKALAMSRGEEDDNRGERERSVRVTGAPPPSPAPTQDQEEGEVMQTLFGPSNKVEDGSTAVVPANVSCLSYLATFLLASHRPCLGVC